MEIYFPTGIFKDVSNFEIKSSDVKNLINIKKFFNDFNMFIKYIKESYCGDEQNYITPYPGFKNIYDDFELFCSKFKIKYEAAESDSDSDSDIEISCSIDSD